VIVIGRQVFSAAFVSGFRRSSTSLVFWLVLVHFACFLSFFHVLSCHFCTCFRLIFPLALAFLFDQLRGLTWYVFRLPSCFDLHCVDLSMYLRALPVISLGGLITFRMLGTYVDSSGTRIPALWVHLSPLDFSVVTCTLVLHSGTAGSVIVYEDFGSRRVIRLFQGRCSTDDLSPLIRL
jgi:hypothetical protein